ncbi:hypothetical protein Pan44_39230 [Caulifigura coniformis]|uniref:JAB domain-containing protein n=1 Tax=Caulifigura coniformis TaxID=2527983 RepID=A0A517SID5_9PLAN|nr:Mov34/MPN/PAD-1 family protein [Caulifigura coniformis]QDT55875.1 hypothetical protein Pan44_39230 [Caulifigura coniformis]
MLIEDIAIVKQQCTAIHVQFDDDAVADFFDQQIDLGRRPETFARVWIHTHPGDSAQPSLTDEKTFRRVFGKCDWAVMAILARGGETTARLRFNTGPGGALPIPAKVAFESPFPASNQLLWSQDYQSKIQTRDPYHGICLPGESEDCVHRMNEGSIFRDANEADLWEAAFW